VLVLITSLGIYGFLTSAFQDTFKTYSVTSKEKVFLQQKEKFWEDDLVRYDKELERISENISTLSSAKSQQIQYKDSDGNIRNTVSTAELRAAQSRITEEEKNRKEVQSKRQVAADSLQSIHLSVLDIQQGSDVAAEVGPLKYMAEITGKPMATIVNWFALLIIFVFDPLAVTLVIAFNTALKVDKGEDDKKKVVQKRELYGETEEGTDIYTEDDFTDWDTTLNDGLEDEKWDDEELENFNKQFQESELSKENEGELSEEEEQSRLEEMGEPLVKAALEKTNIDRKPYYQHPAFDWGVKKLWINDQDAVRYWMTNVNKKQNSRYPDNFDSKTY
jgi:hypothetical protein